VSASYPHKTARKTVFYLQLPDLFELFASLLGPLLVKGGRPSRLRRLVLELLCPRDVALGRIAFGFRLAGDPIRSAGLGGFLFTVALELPAQPFALELPLVAGLPRARQKEQKQRRDHDYRKDDDDYDQRG